jgi:hypothetical protein
LKDDNAQQDFSKLQPIIEIPADNSGDGAPNTINAAFVGSPDPTDYSIEVRYASGKTSPGTAITLKVDQPTLDKFNSVNGLTGDDAYVLAPAGSVSLKEDITIPAGAQKVDFPITVNTSKISSDGLYAIPLKLTSAQGAVISGNYGSVVILLKIKNIYDGDYLATGTLAFPPPQAGRGWTDRAKTLTTINPTTSEVEAADLGGSSYYMYLKVNPDNTVTITSSPKAPTAIINNGPCVYDPATKKFTLNYKYVGGTGDRVISEVLTLDN